MSAINRPAESIKRLFAKITRDDAASPSDPYCGFREETWCVLVHLSALCALLAGMGVIVPIMMWQWSKDQSDLARRHSARMINWIFTAMAAMVMLALLMLIPVSFIRYLLALPGAAIVLLSAFYPLAAARKADQGELWSYPYAFRFISED